MDLTLPHLLIYKMEKITPYRFLRVPTLSKPLCPGAGVGRAVKRGREEQLLEESGRHIFLI